VLVASFPPIALVDLSQSVPGYPPALELRRHLGELLLDPTMHGYTPILAAGLRENYAAHLSHFYGAPITPGESASPRAATRLLPGADESRQGRRPSDPAAPALFQSRHVAAHARHRAYRSISPRLRRHPAAQDAARLIVRNARHRPDLANNPRARSIRRKPSTPSTNSPASAASR